MSETFEHIENEFVYKNSNETISFIVCPDCEKLSYDSENRNYLNKECWYNFDKITNI